MQFLQKLFQKKNVTQIEAVENVRSKLQKGREPDISASVQFKLSTKLKPKTYICPNKSKIISGDRYYEGEFSSKQ